MTEPPRRPPAADLADLVSEMVKLLPRPEPWAQFKAEILPSFSPPMTCKNYLTRTMALIGQIEALDLADEGEPTRYIETTGDLTPNLVRRFVQSREGSGESPFTLRSRLTLLRRICRLAVRFRYLPIDPFDLTPIRQIVRVGKPRNKRALTRDEVGRLFEVLRADVASKRGWAGWKARRLLLMTSLALGTGIRKMELLCLHVADVDLEARVIRLVPRGPRGRGFKSEGSAKPVGLPPAVVPIVREWLEHRLSGPAGVALPECPWMVPNVSRTGPWLHGRVGCRPLCRLQAAGRRAGIADLSWHCLRRTTATMLEGLGVGRSMIQRILRHADVTVTTDFYIKADEAAIAEAVKDIEF